MKNAMKQDKRGKHPNSRANLKQFTREGRTKGGINSGIAKREKKTMREILEVFMSLPSATRQGMSNAEAICWELMEQALQGNLRATELLRDTIGQKPTEADNKHIQGNVYVSWQGADGDSIKAVSSARGAGVSIESSKTVDSSVSVSASEAQAADSNAEG